VMAQQLLPRADGKGRILATELLMPNPAIRNLIRDDKTHQIYSQMQVGQGRSGMCTFNQALFTLVKGGQITQEIAVQRSNDPDELQQMITNDGRPVVQVKPR
jgi:twitching motility protein PilT